jgi:hypothetical protein
MRANGCCGAVIAATALCLALLAQLSPAGSALAQQPAPEHRSGGRPTPSGTAAPSSGAATQPSPGDGGMEAASSGLPGTPGEAPGESKGGHATRLERVLRSVSDPSWSEPNDVHFLVLAVAIYLARLLVVEHLRAAASEDDGRPRRRGGRSDRARGDGGGTA